MRAHYKLSKSSMYGHYLLTKSGTKVAFIVTDSQLYDDYVSGKRVQAKLKRLYESSNY